MKKYKLSEVVEAIELSQALTVKVIRDKAIQLKLDCDWSAVELFRLFDKLEGK